MKKQTMRTLIGTAGLFIFLFSFPAQSAEVGQYTIEQWGITWQFNKPLSVVDAAGTYRYGQFANGDFWLVGPVTITSISPASVEISGRILPIGKSVKLHF